MPKYRVQWCVGSRKPRSLGTLVFADDDAAIQEIAPLCRSEGWGAIISRPDRKWLVARIAADGTIDRIGKKF
jgi:hypothetical protein